MKNINFRKAKIILVGHESVRIGPVYDYMQFLFDKHISELILIEHPLLYLKEAYANSSYFEYYKKGKLYQKRIAHHWILAEPLLYIKDVLYTILWIVRDKNKYDLFIGFDPLNAFAGIILKKLGRVERVVYYSLDYFTQRFQSRLMNKIYHVFDKFCVYFSDETWNVSSAIADSREKYNNMGNRTYNRQYTVPIGIWFDKTPRKKLHQINKQKIVFIGALIPLMGVDLLLKAMPKIIAKIPSVKLEILGSGQEEKKLISLSERLRLTKYVTFHGWITDKGEKWRLLSDAAIGIASFNTSIFRDEVKNADPAKLKDYMVLGMPVIVTDAIKSKADIEKFHCGLVIKYDIDELANAVITLLTDDKKFKQFRIGARTYVRQFDYEKICSTNLTRILARQS